MSNTPNAEITLATPQFGPGSNSQGDMLNPAPQEQQNPEIKLSPFSSPGTSLEEQSSTSPSDTGAGLPFIDMSKMETPDDTNTSLGDVRSAWEKAYDIATTSPLEQLTNWVSQKLPKWEWLNSDHPYENGIARGANEFMNGINRQIYGMTNPAMITAILGAPEYLAVKLAATTAFLYQGLSAALTPKQTNETTPYYLARSGFGVLQAGLTATGMYGMAKQGVRAKIQGELGIGGYLEERVWNKLQSSYKVMAEANKAIEEETASGARATAAQKLRIAELQTKEELSAAEIKAQASKVVVDEKRKLTDRYNALREKFTKPIASVLNMRGTISNAMKDREIPDSVVPSRIYKWLPKNVLPRPLDWSEESAYYKVQTWLKDKNGWGNETIREKLLDEGLDSDSVDIVMKAAGVEAPREVSYNMFTHTMQEVWSAKESAFRSGNGALGSALQSLYGRLDKINAAYTKSYGEQYAAEARAVDGDYLKFQRSLNSKMMQDFLAADEWKDQQMDEAVVNMIEAKGGKQIQKMLGIMGIDVSPLNDIVEKRKELESTDLTGMTEKKIANIKAQSAASISAKDIANPVLQAKNLGGPDRGDLSGLSAGTPPSEGWEKGQKGLVGLDTYEIRRRAIAKFNYNARQIGIKNPNAFTSMAIGGIRLLYGSAFGLFPLAQGATRIGLAEIVRSPTYQEYIIKNAEIEPKYVPAFRRAITSDGFIDAMAEYIDATSLSEGLKKVGTEFPKSMVLPAAIQAGRPKTQSNPHEVLRIAQ